MKSHAVTPSCRRGIRNLRGALVSLAALLGLGVCATEANAQYVYGYTYARPLPGPAFYGDDVPPVSPRGIVFRLQDRGFGEIARPRFDGTAWIVDATNPAGDRVRLFVDARTGGIIGRQRLDAPYYPSNRVARAAPGYGWTEDDAARAQNPDRLVPPGNIPAPGYPPQAGIDRVPPPPRPGTAPRTLPRPLPGASANAGDGNPTGINPDARGETARTPVPRKTAKLTPPAKPSGPEAPRPSTDEQAKAVATPAPELVGTATRPEPSKPEPSAVTPATNQPAAATPAASSAEKPVAGMAATEKPVAKAWQDPPASEPRRNVRVIDGATVVPGSDAPSGTN